MKLIAKAKIRSWYDKGIKMIFAKILYPDFFASAMVFHLVKLSICWNESLEQVRPVGSGGAGGGGGMKFCGPKIDLDPSEVYLFWMIMR